MAASLLSNECLQTLERVRSWATDFDWRRQDSEIRKMLFTITEKVNQLHLLETTKRKGSLVPKNHDQNTRKELKTKTRRPMVCGEQRLNLYLSPPNFLVATRPALEGLSIHDEKSQSGGVGSTAHREQLDQKMIPYHATSSEACKVVHSTPQWQQERKRSLPATSITSIR